MQSSLSMSGSLDHDKAQIFTLEGLSAAMLILIAVHFILQTPSVIVPLTGQHLNVQLEQYGRDILLAMDNPDNDANRSLKSYVRSINGSDLKIPGQMKRDLDLALPNNVMYNVVLRSINLSDSRVYALTLKSNNSSITDIPPPKDSVTANHFLLIYDNELDSNSPFKAIQVNPEQPTQNIVHVIEVRLELWYT